jgi:hypothetical protein
MKEDKLKKKLVEFLEKHRRNPDNYDSEGYYEPNPYWLADELIEFFDKN